MYPAAALATKSAPVIAIAASGVTWRQSSPDAAATARRSARTPPGRNGGSAGSARTHTADATATAPASRTSARAGAHGRRRAKEGPVSADDDTSHRASAQPSEARPAGGGRAASREGGAARPGGRGALRRPPVGGRSSTRAGLVDDARRPRAWSPRTPPASPDTGPRSRRSPWQAPSSTPSRDRPGGIRGDG